MEMCDVLEEVDVGVLDEIQMIGCPDRGWAWTRAVLGLPARDLHLCGDPSVRDLLQRLCDLTGDELRVYEYERLSPLKPMDRPVSNLSSLESGDCIVTFRKADVYMLKRQIGVCAVRRACGIANAQKADPTLCRGADDAQVLCCVRELAARDATGAGGAF